MQEIRDSKPAARGIMGAPPAIHLGPRTLAAYVILWAVLAMLAQGENTAALAAALAWSVLLAVGLAYGPQAIAGAQAALPSLGG